jgi:hypothetical protein
VIQVQPREFNLYLRPDTNTKGYCNWFFFKMRRPPNENGKFTRRRYLFNVLNMYKKKTLYTHEARPLACFTEILQQGMMIMTNETAKWRPS